MDLYEIIGELVAERNRIVRIIASLEEAVAGRGAKAAPAPKKRRGRKSMDAGARREVSERMRKYWAARRSQAVMSKDGPSVAEPGATEPRA